MAIKFAFKILWLATGFLKFFLSPSRNWGKGYSHITVSVNTKPFCMFNICVNNFAMTFHGLKALVGKVFRQKRSPLKLIVGPGFAP